MTAQPRVEGKTADTKEALRARQIGALHQLA
jgi:hypothetical protein